MVDYHSYVVLLVLCSCATVSEQEEGVLVLSEFVCTCQSLASKMFFFLSFRSYNLFSLIECLILFDFGAISLQRYPSESRQATETVALCTVKASQCQGTGSVQHKGASNR